ncbi:MAG TPA: hypothetical protein VGL22_15070, partial [Terracidiphilus sp.]
MIRQAISCDVCGAEKKQTNHWYVTCEQAGELRVSGWSSRMRQRPGTKHLCGQTCLHKLVDEFIARVSGQRVAVSESGDSPATPPEADASLASAVYEQIESSARVIPPAPRPAIAPLVPAVVPMQPRLVSEPAAIKTLPQPIEEAPSYSPRRWRAEAWERERNRELHAL